MRTRQVKHYSPVEVRTRCIAEAFRIYAKVAKERGILFDLTLEEFEQIIDRPCHYCGDEQTNHTTLGYGRSPQTYWHNGVDRVDDRFCYQEDNCVACCQRCNHSKGRRDVEEWLDWIERIARRHRPSSSEK